MRRWMMGSALLCVMGCGGDLVVENDRNNSDVQGGPDMRDMSMTCPAGEVLGATGVCEKEVLPDADNDGLSDEEEIRRGTDPHVADTDGDGLSDGDEIKHGADPKNPDSDGDGVLDATEVFVGTDPATMDLACSDLRQTASLEEKPVDIIFTIDNSGSMQKEIQAVERNINENFAGIIGASGLDYRVIMVSRHGDVQRNEDICVQMPLSGSSCSPVPAEPVNTDRFKHFSTMVSSTNSLRLLLGKYDKPDDHGLAMSGWSQWLRQDAFKIFVEITDDQSKKMDAAEFDAALLAMTPEQFGVPGLRRYVFHSIIGVKEKADPTQAYGPQEPMVTSKCSTGVNTGDQYQRLSILTGGLRFPVCETGSYDAVFRQVAQGIIEQSKLQCQFKAPPSEMGEVIDFDRAMLEYRDQGQVTTISKVSGKDACVPATPGFFVDDRDNVELCPDICSQVSASEMGTLTFVSACKEEIEECVPTSFEVCDDNIDNDCNGFVDDEDPACLG